MEIVPKYLTRYFKAGEDPFISLNDLPLHEANVLKRKHCENYRIGGFYAEDEYLEQRQNIERWIYRQLLQKGGNPTSRVPVYMILGDSPSGEYDIRADIQKDAAELRIPIEVLDLAAITFTFPDSMYKLTLDENGNILDDDRTNTPIVYMYDEIEAVMRKYERFLDVYYVEAQVWNREMLYRYYNSMG